MIPVDSLITSTRLAEYHSHQNLWTNSLRSKELVRTREGAETQLFWIWVQYIFSFLHDGPVTGGCHLPRVYGLRQMQAKASQVYGNMVTNCLQQTSILP